MTGQHWRPRLAAAAAVLFAVPLVTVASTPPAPPGPQAAPIVTEAVDTGAALAAARRQGKPVAVTSLATSTRWVTAQPSGTMKAELAVEPVRTLRDGKWVNIDPALSARGDVVVPKATELSTSFSNGGDHPLLTVGAPGRTVQLGWPGKLPKPVLDGAKATYREVRPGVDLVLKAEASGVVQHLVVKNARAAKALATVDFTLTTDGVTVTAAADGSLAAADPTGTVVLRTPPALMWDASGDRKAPVGVRADGGRLVLTPDAGLLADPAARFPITIDPDWRTADRPDWTKVFRDASDSTHWHGGNDVDTWAKVGNCIGWDGCAKVDVARSYFMFDTAFLNGKSIISANFNATIVYGPSCEAHNHDLYWAYAEIHPGTSWNNAPGGAHIGRQSAQSSYHGCAGYKGIGFNLVDDRGNVRINTVGRTTYYIQAQDENNKYAWRKYEAAATKIVVNYNSRPNPPAELNTEPRLVACKWCGGTPYAGTDFLRLQGKLSDADNDLLTAVWKVYGGPTAEEKTGPTLGSGNIFTTDIDLRNRHGQTLDWTLWGTDGVDGGEWRAGPSKVIVDRIGITAAPGVTGGLYQDDNQWHGGVGVPGTFTFDAAGVSDVDHYLYGWNDPPSTKIDAEALGGKAVVSSAPPGDGPRTLYVQSVDRAGHRSPMTRMRTYVRAGNGPLAQWSFEGNTRDTAFLGNRHGTSSGTTNFTSGAVGTALGLDGATGHVTAPQSVRSDLGFTVSAWAKAEPGRPQPVLSQDNGFGLWFRPDNGGRWTFGNGADTVSSAGTAQTGVWTHLAAVHDPAANQIRLYVNGVLAASKTRTAAPTHTPGSLRMGRSGTDFFAGGLDEVKAYDRVLSDLEITSEVSRDDVQVGYWKLDDDKGTTAANSVAGGLMGVLHGQARFAPTGAVNGSLQLPAATDYLSTGAPVVRTDQSFAIAAWVKQDQAGSAISQQGTVVDGFSLGSRDGHWEFRLPAADAEDRPADEVVRSPAEASVWTHLTGVYDDQAKKIRLYVNGVLTAEAPRVTGFDATGPMLMGGGTWRGGVDEVRAYSRVVTAEEIRGVLGRDNVTAGSWSLDGHAQDSSIRGLHGTPSGNPDYTGGQSTVADPADLALRLDGTPKWVSAPNAVRVDQSFSVAAWARVDQNGGTPSVVSQDGSKGSGFKVRVRSDNRWGFAMSGADDANPVEAIGGSVQIGQWVHLVGVYDAGAKQILLYVNGVLAGTAAHTQNWQATGGLQIGRAKTAGASADFFKGSVDDVAAYSRTLFAAEVQAMAGRDLSLVHNLRLDESSGTNAADAVGTRAATLTGGASFGPGRVGNGVGFDGVDDAATTTGVDLRLDQAFTVSALVKLPDKQCDLTAVSACRLDAVTVDGARTSKFRLGHVVDSDNSQFGAWTFEMPESDVDNAPVTKAAVATLPSEAGKWTHLVGVYDPTAKMIWLYVDGTRVDDGTLNTPWQPTGGLVVGRGKVDGAAARHWPGGVDDIRLYTGQLNGERIEGLFHSYPAETEAPTLPAADAGWWKFDENTGTTAADSSGRGNPATLKGGAGWIGARAGSGAWLNGNSAHAETDGPVLDTGRSFSAAAWVHLTNADHTYKAVLGQDANRLSAFTLQFDGTSKKWSLTVPAEDKDNPAVNTVAILNSVDPAAVGEWTHLAIGYNAATRQIRLYVNGMLAGARSGVTVLPSTGPLSIGRSRWNGQDTAFFPRGIDDVRLYSHAITDGEARKIHDDVSAGDFAHYRFDDGTAKDRAWRQLHGTPTAGATFAAGQDGTALHLNGTTGAVTVPVGLSMRDSFTVAAWAKLSRDDKLGALVSQDGSRMSGFALRYRPGPKRWVFGAAASDSDGAPLVEVDALATPQLDQWTHVAGVYDFPGRQLRIYVNGTLSGTRDNVVLWRATGNLAIGRGKSDGIPYGFFPGALDDVRVSEGVVTAEEMTERGGWSAPRQGQFGRFVNAAGDRFAGSTDQVPAGYRFQTPLGLPATTGPNTAMLVTCRSGADTFTAAGCGVAQKIGDAGLVYTVPPLNIPTVPLRQCVSGTDRFESIDAACEGATPGETLGYTVAYANLVRYYNSGVDHATTIDAPAPAYRAEYDHGLVALGTQDGTQRLMSCQDKGDQFVSVDPDCDDKTVVGASGSLWTVPPDGLESRMLYRCKIGTEFFTSTHEACEGWTVDRTLGHVLTVRPAVTAVFTEES